MVHVPPCTSPPDPPQVRTHGVYEVFNISIRRLQLTTIYLNHVLTPGLGPTNITSGLRVQEPAAPITHLLAYRCVAQGERWVEGTMQQFGAKGGREG